MIYLCFGLPGTGKSTFARRHRNNMTFDLGHNAFRSNEERDKFYKKAQKATGGILRTYAPCKTVYWDTYPEYFNIDDVKEQRNNISIIFAIPDDDMEMVYVINRVGIRDGFNSDFYKLYYRNGFKWRADWWNIYNQWLSVFGHDKVKLISRYDQLS